MGYRAVALRLRGKQTKRLDSGGKKRRASLLFIATHRSILMATRFRMEAVELVTSVAM